MICADMAATGVLGNPREHFINWAPSRQDIDWKERLNTTIKNQTKKEVFSVKVMSSQIMNVDECLNKSTEHRKDYSVFNSFYNTFKDAYWIYLKRNNTLRQAISRAMAGQTGIYHAVQSDKDQPFPGTNFSTYKKDYNDNIEVRHQFIKKATEKINQENLIIEIFFEKNKITPLRINYEDYCNNPKEYIGTILNDLGIKLNILKNNSKTVKLSNHNNEKILDEYIFNYIDLFKEDYIK